MKVAFLIHGRGIGGNETTLRALAIELRHRHIKTVLFSPKGEARSFLKGAFDDICDVPKSKTAWDSLLRKTCPSFAVAVHGEVLGFAAACRRNRIPAIWWIGHPCDNTELLRLGGTLFDHVTAPSNYLVGLLGRSIPVKLLPGAFESRTKGSKVRSNGMRTIGYCARFTEYKNHWVLIRAFEKAQAKHSSLRLVLLGRADTRPEKKLRDQLRCYCKQKKIPAFFSSPTYKQLTQRLASLDLYVSPARGEGFGSALLEAAALGVPVIASRSGAHCEHASVIGEKNYFDVNDVTGLSQMLLKRHKACAKRGLRQYSIKRLCENLLKLVQAKIIDYH